MKLKEAKGLLEKEGYSADLQEVMKNGFPVQALTIGDGAVRPSIYEKTVETIETKDQLLELVQNAMKGIPKADEIAQKLMDPEYILSNCYTCLRPQTNDLKSVCFSVLGDLEEYIRVHVGEADQGSMTTVLTIQMMKNAGLSHTEVREAARNNLSRKAVVKPMFEVLREMMGEMEPGAFPEEETPAMLVGTVEDKVHGAGVMVLDDFLQKICETFEWTGITMLPSPIHEAIFLPYSETENEDVLENMIRDVNTTQVLPEEQLGTHVYHYYAA